MTTIITGAHTKALWYLVFVFEVSLSLKMETLPLPLEVIQIIFEFCLDKHILHPSRAPLLLAQVCVEWRRMTLTTPSLWTTLRIPVTDSVSVIPALRMWLDSSKPLPLNFEVDFSKQPILLYTQNSYSRVLCAHASRWRKASIQLRYEQSMGIFARLLSPGSLPMLQESQLRPGWDEFSTGFGESDQHPNRSLIALYNSCAALHTLSWEERDAVDALSRLSSRSIRCLRIVIALETFIRPFNITTLERCFLQCPNLVSLEMYLPGVDEESIASDGDARPPLNIPRLRELSLTTANFSVLASLLARIQFSCLEELYIYVVSDDDSSDFANHFHDFLTSCSISLRKIELVSDQVIRHPHTTSVLSGLPNLTSLLLHEIYYPGVLTNLFKTLTLRFSPSGRLVSLQNIALRHISLEIDRHTVQDALNIRSELAHQDLQDFFAATVDLVVSRWKLPKNALSFEGGDIEPLATFHVGHHFADLYQSQYPSTWPSVKQGWKAMEGMVNILGPQ